jgi:hypothetical protein
MAMVNPSIPRLSGLGLPFGLSDSTELAEASCLGLRVDPEWRFFTPPLKAERGATEWVNLLLLDIPTLFTPLEIYLEMGRTRGSLGKPKLSATAGQTTFPSIRLRPFLNASFSSIAFSKPLSAIWWI